MSIIKLLKVLLTGGPDLFPRRLAAILGDLLGVEAASLELAMLQHALIERYNASAHCKLARCGLYVCITFVCVKIVYPLDRVS